MGLRRGLFLIAALAVIAWFWPASTTEDSWVCSLIQNKRICVGISWLEAIAWLSAVIAAFLALLMLRQSVYQARASFLLQLNEQWGYLEAARKASKRLHERVVRAKRKELSDSELPEQEGPIRAEFKKEIETIRHDDRDLYDQLMNYLGFFETAGLMVKNGYIPLRDVVQNFRGPIVDAQRIIIEHLVEVQKDPHVEPGFYENFLFLAKKTERHKPFWGSILGWN